MMVWGFVCSIWGIGLQVDPRYRTLYKLCEASWRLPWEVEAKWGCYSGPRFCLVALGYGFVGRGDQTPVEQLP